MHPYISSDLSKEQTSTSLLEKLCHRFRGTHDVQQWRNIAFCVAQLSFSEKSLKKLTELLPCFQDKVWLIIDGLRHHSSSFDMSSKLIPRLRPVISPFTAWRR
jgi:hypothetical protein